MVLPDVNLGGNVILSIFINKMTSKELKKQLLKETNIKKAFINSSKDKNYILSRKLKELRIKNGLTVGEFKKLIS